MELIFSKKKKKKKRVSKHQRKKRLNLVNNAISLSNAIKVEEGVTIKRKVNEQYTNNKKGNKHAKRTLAASNKRLIEKIDEIKG